MDDADTPQPVMTPRQRQIFVAASRLFIEKGFDGTSMSEVARAVGLTKAGLYHFVDSKEDLLLTILNFGMDRLEIEVIAPALAESDPLERLEALVRNHVMNVGRVPTDIGSPLTVVMDETAGLSAENRAAIDARKRRYFDLLRGTLQALGDEGRLQPGLDVTAAAFSIIGMVMWVARWRKPQGPIALETVADQVAQFAIGGVLKP